MVAQCSESTAPFLVPLLNPHCPLFPSFLPTQVISLNTDNINTHELPSVRHYYIVTNIMNFAQHIRNIIPNIEEVMFQ